MTATFLSLSGELLHSNFIFSCRFMPQIAVLGMVLIGISKFDTKIYAASEEGRKALKFQGFQRNIWVMFGVRETFCSLLLVKA